MASVTTLSAKAALKTHNVLLTSLYSEALRAGGVKLTPKSLETAINMHPRFPGFESFHEWAIDHGIKLRVFRTNAGNLSSLVPCLAFFKVPNGRLEPLAMIRETRDGEILLEDEHGLHWESVEKIDGYSCEIFVKVTPPETPFHPAFTNALQKDRSQIWRKRTIIAFLAAASVFAATGFWLIAPGLTAMGLTAHFLLSIVGIALGVALVTLTYGRNSGLMPDVCNAEALSQSGCGSALSSPLSKIVPWIGLPLATLGYFVVMTLAVGIGASIPGLHACVMVTSAIAIVTGLASIYYQGVILKDWCHLCCMMVGVMALQALIALLLIPGIAIHSSVSILTGALGFASLFATVFAILIVAEPHLEGVSEFELMSSHYKQLLQRPQIQSEIFKQDALDIGRVEGDILLGDMSDDAVELALVLSLGCNGCAIAIMDVDRLRNRLSDGVRIRMRMAVEQPNVYFDLYDKILMASAHGRHEEAFSILLAEARNPTRISRKIAKRADPADYSEALQAQLRWYEEVKPPTVPLKTFDGFIYAGKVSDMRYLIQEVAAEVCAARLKKSA